MTPVVFTDTETNGLHAARRAWEIAMIRRDDDHERETHFFVELSDLRDADPFGLNVGRFYERHPYGRYLSGRVDTDYSSSAALSTFEAAIMVATWTHGAHLVGSVPNFDADVLTRLLNEQQMIPAWHYHLIDVENLAVGFLAGRSTFLHPPWKSDDLSRTIGVEPASEDERHTALGDARWARRMYDTIMNRGVEQ